MRFTIWTPLPETAPHAGVKALWVLGRALEARGHQVTMWSGDTMPECDVLILPERTAPATTHPRTVRWVLLHGGQLKDGERPYTWSPAYSDAPVLNVPNFDLDELHDPRSFRWGSAVWVGKGKVSAPIPEDAQIITYDMPRSEVVKILQTVETLISFDPYSAVNTEAALCGAFVMLPIPRPKDMPADFDFGFLWADIPRRWMDTTVRDQVKRINALAELTIDAFVEDMTSWK